MPAELPGFFYDPLKNRYFPIKSSIPGASSNRPTPNPPAPPPQGKLIPTNAASATVQLLRERELSGNHATFGKRKVNIQNQFFKKSASAPSVWKYGKVDKICGAALENMNLRKLTSDGLTETGFIITCCSGGTLSVLEVEQDGNCIESVIKCKPENAVPHQMEGYLEGSHPPLLYRRFHTPDVCMPSSVSSLRILGKDSHTTDDNSTSQKALVATTGSETSRGTIYILNFNEPMEFDANDLLMSQQMHTVASYDCTVWTADCSPKGYEAVIGTNLGARMVNLESGQSSWICRSKSDVLSQQIEHSGNVVLCGLRNGAILSFDIRQKGGSCGRLNSHKILYPLSTVHKHSSHSFRKRNWFEIKGDADISRNIFMPSSISSMRLLRSSEQYFLASSMDGTIKLYDQRMNNKGEVQNYEGHINSHTRIQLGVDPSDTLLMSGGEDSYMRIWDIKSGQLLYAAKFMNSIPSTLCWPISGFFTTRQCQSSSGAWVGSKEGLYLMLWP